MSGYASDVLEAETDPPARANLLQKPFSMGALARKVRSALKSNRAADLDLDGSGSVPREDGRSKR
jgi:hypothetical protein